MVVFASVSRLTLVISCSVFTTALVVPLGEVHKHQKRKFMDKFIVRPGFDEHAPRWLDSRDRRIEAHGAGILQSPEDGRWYWYGESRKGDQKNPGVNCYSADSLAGPWKNHGRVFSSSDIHVDGWTAPFIVERPKVLYNAKTSSYVMWAHVDHVASPEFLTAERKPFATPQMCDNYVQTTTCAWTANWSCPLQRPGRSGQAGADGTIGYHCCCDLQLWRNVRADECAKHLETNTCHWTKKYNCPGQARGTKGVAINDQSVEYQCCCDHGHWEKLTNSTGERASLMQVDQRRGGRFKARGGRRLVSKLARWKKLSQEVLSDLVARARSHVNRTRKKMAEKPASNTTHPLKDKRRQRFVSRYRSANSYTLRRVAVATSDNPIGPFELQHILAPDNIPSLDLNLWLDTDGTAYFIRSCDNAYTGISKLTDDFLNTTGLISQGPRVEGMALFRHTNGTLYMMTSHLTGWKPNPLMLYRSDGPSLADPQWVDLGNPSGHPTSFNTQPTTVVQYTTHKGLTYNIYMADNWVYGGRQGLFDATYVWLPIRVDDNGDMRLESLQSWNLEDPFGDEEKRMRKEAMIKKRLARQLEKIEKHSSTQPTPTAQPAPPRVLAFPQIGIGGENRDTRRRETPHVYATLPGWQVARQL